MRIALPTLVLATTLMAAAAYAGGPADVAARQANFKSLGKAFKGVNDELKNSTPSASVVRDNANTIAKLAGDLPHWFPKGSGPEAGVKTGALPGIWQDHAGFDSDAHNLLVAARALKAAADKGDMAQVAAASRDLGGACKTCHQQFRARDDH